MSRSRVCTETISHLRSSSIELKVPDCLKLDTRPLFLLFGLQHLLFILRLCLFASPLLLRWARFLVFVLKQRIQISVQLLPFSPAAAMFFCHRTRYGRSTGCRNSKAARANKSCRHGGGLCYPAWSSKGNSRRFALKRKFICSTLCNLGVYGCVQVLSRCFASFQRINLFPKYHLFAVSYLTPSFVSRYHAVDSAE